MPALYCIKMLNTVGNQCTGDPASAPWRGVPGEACSWFLHRAAVLEPVLLAAQADIRVAFYSMQGAQSPKEERSKRWGQGRLIMLAAQKLGQAGKAVKAKTLHMAHKKAKKRQNERLERAATAISPRASLQGGSGEWDQVCPAPPCTAHMSKLPRVLLCSLPAMPRLVMQHDKPALFIKRHHTRRACTHASASCNTPMQLQLLAPYTS